ncbi:transmembrane anti-sigma factor [Marinobacter santoriniensis NKSG1]|uniref:Transmembrane anti-sigma factor n=1 Tax=Marinobacter santoriniensis NKSG1 TaxID=1288826 RepID=M7D0C9_9GAMM|nr:zf-HC2 domain-containing protein [Marinobacter santoriniensis]EMP54218.1 transmembrane anti-sigma factor [Marinobacter santoriniensis NKSG1]
MNMSCRETRESLAAYLDNELSDHLARRVSEHLSGCSACSNALEEERCLRAGLVEGYSVPAPSADFESRVLRAATRGAPDQGRWSHRVLGGAVAAALALGVSMGVFLNGDRQAGSDTSPVLADASPEPAAFQPVEKTVRLAFSSGQALDDVTLTLELPPNVEIASWPGRHELSWKVSLDAGENVLALPLKVLFPGAGQLVAHLNTGKQQKSFKVDIPTVEKGNEVPAS